MYTAYRNRVAQSFLPPPPPPPPPSGQPCIASILIYQSVFQSTAELVAAEIAAISSSADLSSREKNRAKRRAKILAKQRSKDNNSPVPGNSSKYVGKIPIYSQEQMKRDKFDHMSSLWINHLHAVLNLFDNEER